MKSRFIIEFIVDGDHITKQIPVSNEDGSESVQLSVSPLLDRISEAIRKELLYSETFLTPDNPANVPITFQVLETTEEDAEA